MTRVSYFRKQEITVNPPDFTILLQTLAASMRSFDQLKPGDKFLIRTWTLFHSELTRDCFIACVKVDPKAPNEPNWKPLGSPDSFTDMLHGHFTAEQRISDDALVMICL